MKGGNLRTYAYSSCIQRKLDLIMTQKLLTQHLMYTGYPSKSEKLWSMEKMKTYFCLIRNLQPTLSDVGNQVLLRYYQMQRQSDSRNAARTTIRLLESLIRLAEGLFHSRNEFSFVFQCVQGMGLSTINSKIIQRIIPTLRCSELLTK